MPFLVLALLLAQEPLSLQEAVSLALAHHPKAAAAEARVRATEAWREGAGAQPNPEVRLSGTRGDPGEDANALVQTLEIGGQTGLRRSIADTEADVARHALQARRREVARETAAAYFEAWAAGERQEVASERLGLARQLEQASQARLEAGEISTNAHLRTQFEVARAEADLADTDALAEAARQRLNLLLGRSPDSPVALALEARPLEAPDPQANPEVEALRRSAEAARLEADLAGRARAPDLELSAYRSRLFGNAEEQGVQVTLVLPLFDYGRISSHQERLRLEAEARGHEADARALEVQAELATANAARKGAAARLAILRAQADRARRMADLATRGYQAGLLSLPEVLDAQAALRLTLGDLISAEAALRTAEAELYWLSGGDLPAGGSKQVTP